MHLIVSESLAKSTVVTSVARELSLNISAFGSTESLRKQLNGHGRRILLVAEEDITDATVRALEDGNNGQFGVVLRADREALRLSSQAALLDHDAKGRGAAVALAVKNTDRKVVCPSFSWNTGNRPSLLGQCKSRRKIT